MATEATAAAVDTDDTEEATDPRQAAAARIVRHNMYWSMGAGLIPWVVVDTAAAIAVQLKMLKELGDLYDVPFSANAGKSAVLSLLASVTGGVVGHKVLGAQVLRRLSRHTPVFGTIIGVATMPAFYAAFTYAVGKIFNEHLASGGTFLSFNAKEAEADFQAKFAEGQAKASKAEAGKAAADKTDDGKAGGKAA